LQARVAYFSSFVHKKNNDFAEAAATPLLCPSDCANSSRARSTPGWRRDVSDHNEIVYSTADGMDYPAHEGTYKAFIKMGTIGTGVVITIVSLMAIFLT
jgi:hypothetical protein